jgi:hypothetical protein
MVASMLLLTPALAFYIVAPLPPQRPVVMPRSQPKMMLPQTGFLAPQTAIMEHPAVVQHLPAIQATTEVLAKSKADETLDDIFAAFPIAFTGLVLGGYFLVVGKKSLQSILPEDLELPEYAALAFIPIFSFGFVIASKAGVLNFLAGTLAKGMLDGWNVFASVALPGALLKY